VAKNMTRGELQDLVSNARPKVRNRQAVISDFTKAFIDHNLTRPSMARRSRRSSRPRTPFTWWCPTSRRRRLIEGELAQVIRRPL